MSVRYIDNQINVIPGEVDCAASASPLKQGVCMRKNMATVVSVMALSGVLGLSGCGNVAVTGSSDPVRATPIKNSKAGKSDSIKADDIELTVEEGFWYDERQPVFTFTNNSDFDIITVDIDFSQKADMTDEQRAQVFAEFMSNEFYQDDDFTTYVLSSYKEQLVPSGETSLEAEVTFNNTGRALKDISFFDWFEPSIMKVAYLGGDGKMYLEYIDFKTGKTKDASKGGKDAVMWSDSDLAKRIPKIDAPVCLVTTDDEDGFWFETLGMTIDDYGAYVEKLKEMGYDQVDYEDDDEFRAHDKDGYEATASFVETKGAIYAHLDTEDVVSSDDENSSSASQQVSADFKKSMDEYEQFFNEYADFVKTYKDSGSPTAMAGEYADVMAQYGKTMQEFSNLDSSNLSPADAAYLLEVQGRITAKIASV